MHIKWNNLRPALLGNINYDKKLPFTIKKIAEDLSLDIKQDAGYDGGLLLQSKKPQLTIQLLLESFEKPSAKTSEILKAIDKVRQQPQTLDTIKTWNKLKFDLVEAQLGASYERFVSNFKIIDKRNFYLLGNFFYDYYSIGKNK